MACECLVVGQLHVTLLAAKPVLNDVVRVKGQDGVASPRVRRGEVVVSEVAAQGRKHLLCRDGLHVELRALHHRAAVLVLARVRQQRALVEEDDGLGAVRAAHLDVNAPAPVVVRQTPLHAEGVAALQAAVAASRQADVAARGRAQVGHVRWHGVAVVQQPVQRPRCRVGRGGVGIRFGCFDLVDQRHGAVHGGGDGVLAWLMGGGPCGDGRGHAVRDQVQAGQVHRLGKEVGTRRVCGQGGSSFWLLPLKRARPFGRTAAVTETCRGQKGAGPPDGSL